MADPKLIISPLSRVVEENGERVDVRIYRLDDTDWSLEIVASDGYSMVWDDLFLAEEAALDEAMGAIKDEGIDAFFEGAGERGGLRWALELSLKTVPTVPNYPTSD